MSCGYQGYEFGASYPDSLCIDGYLHDADDCDNDGNIYLQEEEIPCPVCHPRLATRWWYERNCLSGAPSIKALECARSLVKDIRRNRGL